MNSRRFQDKVVVVTQLLAEQFEITRHRAHFRRPSRVKQAEIIPEVFDVFPPFMKICSQRFPADKFEGIASALVSIGYNSFPWDGAIRSLAHVSLRSASR